MTAATALRPYVLAALVTLGLATAWFVAAAWLMSMAETATIGERPYQQPYFRANGEVVILRYPHGPRNSYQEIVDLSGQAVEVSASELLAVQPLYRAQQAKQISGAGWASRLAGVNDGGAPPTYWYLVHDGRAGGSAYGVGYHSVTRQVVGYFGRQGFASTLPSRSEWFAVAGEQGLALSTHMVTNSEPTWTSERELHLLASGKLWQIDPRQKVVRALADAPPGASLGWIWDLRDAKRVSAPSIPAVNDAGSAPRKLVVRTEETLILVDPAEGARATVPLPRELQESALSGCELAGGELSLVAYGSATERMPNAAMRLNPRGEIVARQAMHLDPFGGGLFSEAHMGWFSLAAAPFSLGQAPLVLVMPLQLVQTGQADSYGSAFLANLSRAWPALAGALLIGAVCAVAAYRRQVRYALPGAIGWGVFAFLFGLPGWIAYRFHRTWPVVEECPACDQLAARNRAACTECGALFPPPELKGFEVFLPAAPGT
jgi:hypothetical protein